MFISDGGFEFCFRLNVMLRSPFIVLKMPVGLTSCVSEILEALNRNFACFKAALSGGIMMMCTRTCSESHCLAHSKIDGFGLEIDCIRWQERRF
jgi:hypothetical protein